MSAAVAVAVAEKKMKKIVSQSLLRVLSSLPHFSCHTRRCKLPNRSAKKKVTFFQTRISRRRIAHNLINCANNCASELQCQTMTLFPPEKLAFRRSPRQPRSEGTVSPYAVVLSAGNTGISSGERKLRSDIRRCINVDEEKASGSAARRGEEDKTERRKIANVNVLGRNFVGPVIQNYR